VKETMVEEREAGSADFDATEIGRRIRAIEEHANRVRNMTENDVVPLLRAIYDQVHATRHAIERLVGLMEGGLEGPHDA
jgi:DNA-binding FrmR family transcriptional regulator